MPTYGGGKAKLGKKIYNFIIDYSKKINCDYKTYIEPFCGMLGVGIHTFKQDEKKFDKFIFNDLNKNIILLWKELINEELKLPKNPINKLEYDFLRKTKEFSSLKGFYGIACAYSGIYFAGYRIQDNKSNQNFYERFRKSIIKDSKLLIPFKSKIKFISKSFIKLKPKNAIIYCDPPYRNNKFNSEYFNNFDHDLFWNTMRKWSKNNLVFISEYEAPSDFKCVWKEDIIITHKNVKKKKEKLFIYNN